MRRGQRRKMRDAVAWSAKMAARIEAVLTPTVMILGGGMLMRFADFANEETRLPQRIHRREHRL
jgi:hypothetical protein